MEACRSQTIPAMHLSYLEIHYNSFQNGQWSYSEANLSSISFFGIRKTLMDFIISAKSRNERFNVSCFDKILILLLYQKELQSHRYLIVQFPCFYFQYNHPVILHFFCCNLDRQTKYSFCIQELHCFLIFSTLLWQVHKKKYRSLLTNEALKNGVGGGKNNLIWHWDSLDDDTDKDTAQTVAHQMP